jgi:HK97 family phage prohead protease
MFKRYGAYLARNGPIFSTRVVDEPEPRLCIEGRAVILDEPFATNGGELIVLEKGCLDEHLSAHRRTEMWLAHDPKEVVGSTDSGLQLCLTDDGLFFRFPLTNKRYASTIKRMVESGTQAAISVGITRTKEREERVGSHTVVFVEQAELRECSLVAEGSCEVAFARLVDAKRKPTAPR